MTTTLAILASVATLVAGAVGAMAARIQGGSLGVLAYVMLPQLALIGTCGLLGGPVGALAGFAALTFATGAYAGGFSARPLLVRLRLMEPKTRYSDWS